MRYFFTTLWLFSILLQLNGQETDKIANNLYQQIRLFPQEKVYMMTDKAAYVAGEQIWFRAFLTDAIGHREDIPKSRYVYVDLISPNGTIVKHHQNRPDSKNVFHNRIELDDDMAEGTYLIRAYTTYMRAKPEYIFERRVFVADPLSSVVAIEPQFTFDRSRDVSVSFRFRNLKDSSFLSVETVKIKVGEADLQEFPARRRTISFRVERDKDKHIYVTLTHAGKQYRKFIPIPYPTDTQFDVSFFPEGGWLMEETPNKIGFKALRVDGLSEEITGEVYDSNNNHVASIKSLHAGMGSFILSPETGKSYYALCTSRDSVTLRFELPIVKPNVCALRVIQRRGQFLITALDNRKSKEGSLSLIAHIRGMTLYADKMPPNNMVALQATELPPGIIQILLLDEDMNPISERLIFNRPHDFAKATLTPNQPDYGRRAPVKMDILLELPEGYNPTGSFALSVTDDRDLLPDSTMTITSCLLLSSELRGHIEDAGYYMNDDSEAIEALDALMLTQGWRRYDIPSIAKGVFEEPNSYIEGGQEFSGSVKELLLGKAVHNGSVWLMAPDYEFMREVTTDQSGKFYFSGFEFPDSTRYTLFARAQKDKRVELTLDPELPMLPASSVVALPKKTDPSFSDYVAKAERKYIEEQGMRVYEIPEVMVTAKKKEDEGRSIYSSEIIQRTIQPDVIERNQLDIVAMLKQSGDLFVSEVNRNVTVFVRPAALHADPRGGWIPAQIIVNDIPMVLGFNIDLLTGAPIHRIEILKAPHSYIFGTNGAGGAVLITTGLNEETTYKYTPHMVSITPLGYKLAAEFYSPKYETDLERNTPKPDLRTTIYWKPDVQVIDGEASIEFYTADAANTTYSVVLEGITDDGVILRQIGRINIIK